MRTLDQDVAWSWIVSDIYSSANVIQGYYRECRPGQKKVILEDFWIIIQTKSQTFCYIESEDFGPLQESGW